MNAVESIKYIYPELTLLVFSAITLISGLFLKKSKLFGILSLGAIALAGYFLMVGNPAFGVAQWSVPTQLFSNLMLNDSLSRFFKELSLLITFTVILISLGYKIIPAEEQAEYYFLLLVTTVGIMLAVSSNNLLMIYVAFETISIISYILVGFLKRDKLSTEASLKYFIYGTLATGIMLYGISFIYGVFGTVDIPVIQANLFNAGTNNLAVSISLLLIFAGMAFKCALFPFHMWVPDVYQGAPTPITGFISVAPKMAGFVVLLRLFLKDSSLVLPSWADLLTIVSIVTMTAGNIIALSQTNIKRMLAYSSIAHAGYILIGIVTGSVLGVTSVLFYILVYAVMNLGAFGCVVLISDSIKSDSIEDYSGLHKKDPVSAFMLTVFLLSLAGIPPLAGFMAKFLLFAAAIEVNFVLLAVVAAINSVIAFYYYVRVIKCMYFDELKPTDYLPKSIPLQAALVVTLIAILILGIWPYPFLNWVNAAISH